jgi:plasmid rolling circle replication initiator protein Rep
MAKIIKSIKPEHYLDTLGLSRIIKIENTRLSQYRTAFRKHKTLTKLTKIIDATKDKKQRIKYWRTYHCRNVVLQNGDNFKSSLCRKRWCSCCCRIKTAELTNGYKQPLMELGQLYFVTLTRPNVKGRQLKSEIRKLIQGFTRIKNNMQSKNYSIKIQGMRKLEVTYNETTDTYHPHFHIIMSDYLATQTLLNLWYKQFPTANSKAQDVRAIKQNDEQSFIELFKYATKETTKDGEEYSGEVLNTIYSSLNGIKLYQKYGTFKKVKEPIEVKEHNTTFTHILPNQDIFVYDKEQKDWVGEKGNLLVDTQYITQTLKINQEHELSNQN